MPTREQKADAAKKAARTERVRLGVGVSSTALRDLATSKDGFESGPEGAPQGRLPRHRPRVSQAPVLRVRRDGSARARRLRRHQRRRGHRRRCSRSQSAEAVEWEKDDTDAFLEAWKAPHDPQDRAHVHRGAQRAGQRGRGRFPPRRSGARWWSVPSSRRAAGRVPLRLDDGAMACLPEEESIQGKKYSQGERVCALVLDVEDGTWAADRRRR